MYLVFSFPITLVVCVHVVLVVSVYVFLLLVQLYMRSWLLVFICSFC